MAPADRLAAFFLKGRARVFAGLRLEGAPFGRRPWQRTVLSVATGTVIALSSALAPPPVRADAAAGRTVAEVVAEYPMQVVGQYAAQSARRTLMDSMLTQSVWRDSIPGMDRFEPVRDDSYDWRALGKADVTITDVDYELKFRLLHADAVNGVLLFRYRLKTDVGRGKGHMLLQLVPGRNGTDVHYRITGKFDGFLSSALQDVLRSRGPRWMEDYARNADTAARLRQFAQRGLAPRPDARP